MRWQDWYRGCVKAARLQQRLMKSGDTCSIVVTTDVHLNGCWHDAQYYARALRKSGAVKYQFTWNGYETIGELEAAKGFAASQGAQLIVVTTFAHYLRVAYLMRKAGIRAKHYCAFGLPRWKEMVTDVILTFAFPLIDLCGKREWFVRLVVARRKTGKM